MKLAIITAIVLLSGCKVQKRSMSDSSQKLVDSGEDDVCCESGFAYFPAQPGQQNASVSAQVTKRKLCPTQYSNNKFNGKTFSSYTKVVGLSSSCDRVDCSEEPRLAAVGSESKPAPTKPEPDIRYRYQCND